LLVPLDGPLQVTLGSRQTNVERLGAVLVPAGGRLELRAPAEARILQLRWPEGRFARDTAAPRQLPLARPGTIAASTARLLVAWELQEESPNEAAREVTARFACEIAGRVKSGEPTRPGRLDELRARLEASLGDVPSLRRAADLVDCHRIHLARIFRRRYGCSLGDFVHRRRIDHAVAAIGQRRRLDLSGLAAELGFADQSHLTRVFRRHVGTTPGVCARLLRTAP
jgi:AraC-like DNA-binding protein